MKALSLWQPWASAIAAGLKKIETRGRLTHYRGPLAIAATKHTPRAELGFFEALDHYEAAAFAHIGLGTIEDLPRGAIVATVDLVDCVRMTPEWISGVPAQEQEWGLYQPGRYGWLMANIQRLDPPVPVARGGQFLWEWRQP